MNGALRLVIGHGLSLH